METPSVIFSGAQVGGPVPKVVHRLKFVAPEGDHPGYVSALCYKSPRPIDLTTSSWTANDYKVTCRKCVQRLREGG
jgi:hypothetical protein